MTTAHRFAASYSVTEINKSGSQVYDDAWVNGGVEITRRGQRFALIRQDYLDKLIEEAREGLPNSLADLLADYDPKKIRKLTSEFAEAPPVGKEMI
jgi:hypothetical protein